MSLDAQASARKERLAKLRNLKRKQDDTVDAPSESVNVEASTVILSGRNYDIESKGPKLGFDIAPSNDQETLESQAASIAIETRNTINDDDGADKTIDLLSLQPKKPNWDLKRDVDEKLKRLDHLTNNAIARIVRDRILQGQASSADAQGSTLGENLAEAVKRKEMEKDDPIDGEYT
ncbi:hypothetical protein ABW19_dt0206575 [Dactylella cylindrospora]|nr:hypothetical protein ABW19_dt0206575 [Dactylella cylindrospora]